MADEEFANLPSRIGAQLAGYDERDHFDIRQSRRMSRSSKLALVAAAQAIEQAGLERGDVERCEVGVVIGSSIGSFSSSESFFKGHYLKQPANPLVIPLSMNSAPSSNVSIRYGFQGPLMNVDAACASATRPDRAST